MEKKIPLARPNVGAEELESVRKVFESGILTEGVVTEEFENEFETYLGVKNAIATSSCTTALHLALLALGIGSGDEVIVPDFTFPATGNVVFHVGAKPVLVDIDIKSYNIHPKEIKKAITKRTKAIIPVHLFGQSAEMKQIMEITEKYSLHVVEDAACGIGATHHGKKVGTFGDIACFSFHPRKILAIGEGGMLVTNNDELAEKARALKNHGIRKTSDKSYFVYPGYNFRLNDVASAIGLVQLKKLDRFIQKRIELAKEYDKLLHGAKEIETPYKLPYNKHTYQTYCVMIQREHIRDQMISGLAAKGIETQIGTYALHLQPCYSKHKDAALMDLNFSEMAFRGTLALPVYDDLKKEEQERVCRSLVSLLSVLS